MADDRPEDKSVDGLEGAAPSPDPGRPRRAPPTIDLEATEVSSETRHAGGEAAPEPTPEETMAAESGPAKPGPAEFVPEQPAAAISPWVIAPVSGAVAAALVIGVGWMLGWPPVQPATAPQVSAATVDALATRVAGVESRVSKPATPVADPATVARIAALEKSQASLRDELTAMRAQSEKLAAEAGNVKSPPGETPAAPAVDLSAITERLDAIERANRTESAEIAQQTAKPIDDAPLRRVVVASLLDLSVRQGDPFAAKLAAAKALAPDAATLKPLESFATTGVPTAASLSRELLTLVPKLSPPAPENSTTGGSLVDRLKAGASNLVRIERLDAVGNDRGAIVARVTAAALRNDSNEARRELNTLSPADRAPAQSWIDKADARDAALAASRQFATDAMAALAKPRNRLSMIRIIFFLLLIALASAGAAWVADQPGDVVMTWGGWRASPHLPVFVLLVGLAIVAAVLLWSILRALWRTPGHIRRRRRERRVARGRHAITQGLLAIGHGDSAAARAHSEVARRHAAQDPLALLLHAQSAQLDGDRAGAQRAFRAMAEREDTRLLGLRGLFIEAQRADDPVSAVMIAEETLKMAPSSTWASQAVLGFRCAKGDWSGALAILESNFATGLIDKPTYRRQRGVLLTARALELETVDRDLSRDSVLEAIKLAPTLVPAAVLASKYESEAHQIRRSMRMVEAAWLAQPHPDLADAYAHVKLGDSARQRLVRIETLAAKVPGHLEGALALARAAIDATEYARARAALEPFIAAPTQRVAMLMAEIERTEHGDSGRARAWTLRAVRALHDPVWTADGYVSANWRPVSPVTGRLDAFQWQTPVAALPSDKNAAIEPSPFEAAMLAPRRDPPARLATESPVELEAAPIEPAPVEPAPVAAQDNSPAAELATEPETEPDPPAAPAPPPPAEVAPTAAVPLFRARQDLPKGDLLKAAPGSIPAVIPIQRAPDDPGVDDEGTGDEFVEQIGPGPRQAAGWRGFLARWGA